MHSSTNAATTPAPPPERDSPTPASESHAEEALDEALKESFPASDPIAIAIPKAGQQDASNLNTRTSCIILFACSCMLAAAAVACSTRAAFCWVTASI